MKVKTLLVGVVIVMLCNGSPSKVWCKLSIYNELCGIPVYMAQIWWNYCLWSERVILGARYCVEKYSFSRSFHILIQRSGFVLRQQNFLCFKAYSILATFDIYLSKYLIHKKYILVYSITWILSTRKILFVQWNLCWT